MNPLIAAIMGLSDMAPAQMPSASKFSQALMPTDKPGHFTVMWRALERNKYAPWGRGALGGRNV